MRIRNSRNHPQRSLSPPTPPPSPPPPQHVMVSRINSRLSSIDNGSDSKGTIDSWSMSTTESFGHGLFGQTSTSSNSVSSSRSNTGRWCEEEKAIPLKKRRVVIDAFMEEKKGWRCNKMKMKGRRLCHLHLEMHSNRNTHIPTTTISNEEEVEATTSFAVSGNQMVETKRVKVVKARSISSLLRDTVTLY